MPPVPSKFCVTCTLKGTPVTADDLYEVSPKMNELLMALWAMTATHHQWPAPPKDPVAVVQMAERNAANRTLSTADRQELKKALDRMAGCATGRMAADWDAGFYVPAQKPAISCGPVATTAPE